MSLSHSKYLITLDSERRVSAVFQSLSVQTQIDLMRKDIHTLFETVERILNIQEGHEKEHAAMYNDLAASQDPTQPAITTKGKQSPYI